MIKTVTVNVAGQVFHIDEDAFDALSAYLKAIKSMYAREEGGDEILADIESRIAEVFIERLRLAGKNVVSLADVEHVVSMLGKPEEFENAETGEKEEGSRYEKATEGAQKAEKRFFRNPDDQVIAGVCSGMASYFGISDPLWIRLIFILLVVTGIGSGFLIYIILWIIVPEAKTAAQKLQMKGEPVTLENLEKSFKEGMQNLENNIQSISNEGSANKVIRGLGQIIATLGKAVFIFIKGLIIFISAVVGFAIVAALFALTVAAITAIPFLNDFLFESPVWGILGVMGLVLVLATISISLILAPFQLFSNRAKPFRKEVNWSLTILAIIGTIFLFAGAMNVTREFSTEETISKVSDIPDSPALDTLIIRTSNNNPSGSDLNIRIGWKKYEVDGEGRLLGKVRLNLEASPDSSYHMLEEYSAHGRDATIATRNVRNLSYNYRLMGNQLLLDDQVGARVGRNKWRDQKVDMTLQVPNGTVLIFSDMSDMIRRKPPVKTGNDYIPLESTAWRMENGFLVPLDTNIIVDNNEQDATMTDMTPSKSFESVHVSGFMNVEVIKGREPKVLTNATEKVNVTVSGNKLKLETKPSIYTGNKRAPKIKIYMPVVEEITMTGLCETELTGFTSGDLRVEANGSSTFILNGASMGELNIELNGVSNFKGFGKMSRLNIEASGSSSLKGYEMEVDRLNIQLSGASDAEANVTEKIVGELSGASTLTYKGKPAVDVKTSGAAKLKSLP